VATPIASPPTPDGRVSTGNAGLDTMLEGGLIPRRPYLVVGPSGTGKTTLALQFLCEGIRHHERALLVTLEEPPNEARVNHRGFSADLDQVDVFDAIPDIMRYERVPFKDIASVRYAQPFSTVPLAIRRSPELASVEVTLAALEQMLRTEVIRKGYTRIAVDSLTALQYFCMKGIDGVAGAQTFLRFLSDLRVTTILTVESPLEDLETPERALARGEIRLFRWEHENLTVRAIGVEKFRGSAHDVRLHPYRIGPRGLDINLAVTISRDTRQIVEPAPLGMGVAAPVPIEEVISPVDPLAEEIRDLVLVGADVGPIRTEILAAIDALESDDVVRSRNHLGRATALVIELSGTTRPSVEEEARYAPDVSEAFGRLIQRSESARAGLPPMQLPPPSILEYQLHRVLAVIPIPPPTPTRVEPSIAPEETVPEPTLIPEAPETAPEEAPPLTPGLESPADSGPESPVVEALAGPQSPDPASVAARPEPIVEAVPGGATRPTDPAVPVQIVAESPPVFPEPRPAPTRVFPSPPVPPATGGSKSTPPDSVRSAGRPSPGRSPTKGGIPDAAEPRPPLPSFAPTPAPPKPPSTVAEVAPVPRSPPVGPSAGPEGSHGRAAGPPMPSLSLPPVGAPAESVPAPTVPTAAATPAAKRRRKASAGPRRKAVAASVRSEPSSTAVIEPSESITPPSNDSAASSRAKKRAPRRRKAPTVVSAVPGPMSAGGEVTGAESPAEPSPSDPPGEGE
jgi:KaiC/GvpD/RAD55 family RecA-like ATPase